MFDLNAHDIGQIANLAVLYVSIAKNNSLQVA